MNWIMTRAVRRELPFSCRKMSWSWASGLEFDEKARYSNMDRTIRPTVRAKKMGMNMKLMGFAARNLAE